MKRRRIWAAAWAALLCLTLTGCLFRSPEELYRPPEKSAGYEQLNQAIRQVRNGLEAEYGVTAEDASIISGDNTATIQLQDLDGDGSRESAVAFLRLPGAEKPLKILVFTQVGEEEYALAGMVEGEGSAVYAIEYSQLNGQGRKELVVTWQISTGAYQLGVYTLDELPPAALAMVQNSGQDPAAAPQVDLEGMAAMHDADIPRVIDDGLHGVHAQGQFALGEHKVQLGHEPERLGDVGLVATHLLGQVPQDALNLLPLLAHELLELVVDFHDGHGFDK